MNIVIVRLVRELLQTLGMNLSYVSFSCICKEGTISKIIVSHVPKAAWHSVFCFSESKSLMSTFFPLPLAPWNLGDAAASKSMALVDCWAFLPALCSFCKFDSWSLLPLSGVKMISDDQNTDSFPWGSFRGFVDSDGKWSSLSRHVPSHNHQSNIITISQSQLDNWVFMIQSISEACETRKSVGVLEHVQYINSFLISRSRAPTPH